MKTVDIQAFDNNIQHIMKYVAIRRHGYMNELKPYGENAINSIKSVGFLKTGWTKNEETFGATKLLQKYVEIVFGKISFREKFKFFINRFLDNNRQNNQM